MRGPGVIIGRKGSLGTVYFSAEDFWPHDTTLWVKDFHGNDPGFAYYFLQSMHFERLDAGASNPTLNRNHIHTIPVLWPPLEMQRCIAAILSAYDDLIENCERRIRVLDGMARALYREWFVDFRYPGHEKVPMVESPLGPIPKGWETSPARALGEYVNGYAFKPSDWHAEGLPIIKIRELKAGVTNETPRYPHQLPSKYGVRHGDLLFSWSADLDVYIWPNEEAWLNQHLFLVVPSASIPRSFAYLALREAMPKFRALSNGATMKHIKRGALDQVELILPPQRLLKKFESLVASLIAAVGALRRSAQNLRKSRDLLLPRLLSGELTVKDVA